MPTKHTPKKNLGYKLLSIVGAIAVTTLLSTSAFAEESGDSVDDFLNAPPEETQPAVELPPPEEKSAAKPAAKSEAVDLRTADPVTDVAVAQPNPAVDKIEALMIAEAEMKAFMKSGGLRSRKIK